MKTLKFSILFLLVVLVGCTATEIDSETSVGYLIPTTNLVEVNPVIETSKLPPEVMEYIYAGTIGGLGFKVINPEFEIFEERRLNGIIYFTGEDDYLLAVLENISAHDHNFIMKVFINYESLPFRVVGEENFVDTFNFSLNSGYEISLPFELDFSTELEHATYQLTVAIFGDPERHMADRDAHWSFRYPSTYSIIVERQIIFGQGSDVRLNLINTAPIIRRENRYIPEISIRHNFDTNDFRESAHFSPHQLEIVLSPNEEIDLTWIINTAIAQFYEGGLMIADEYVIVGLLDWNQIPLNGHDYMFVDVELNELQHPVDLGYFALTAPSEPGRYELILFVSLTPTGLTDLLFPLESTLRKTITVVE